MKMSRGDYAKLPFQAIFSREKRYTFLYLFFRTIVEAFGFRLYNKSLLWHKDISFQEMMTGFPPYKKRPIHERRFTLHNLLKAVRHIPGDTVECGVLEGEGSYIILKTINDPQKQHHIFDSFEGLSAPDQKDLIADAKHYQWKENDLSVGENFTRKNLEEFQHVSYWKGWIPDRFSEVSDRTFSFVHIDVDLYQPTLDSLVFFYPRMENGGAMVFDDYGFDTCPGAYKAINEFFSNKPEELIHLTVGTGFIIKV